MATSVYHGRMKKEVDGKLQIFYPETSADQVIMPNGANLSTTIEEKSASTLSNATAYVDAEIQKVKGNAPDVLDTIEKLSKALGDNKDFAATINQMLSEKANDSEVVKLTGSLMTGPLKVDRNDFDNLDNTTILNKAEVLDAISKNSSRFVASSTQPGNLRSTDLWFEVIAEEIKNND